MSLMAIRRIGPACFVGAALGILASLPAGAADGLLTNESMGPPKTTRDVPGTLLEALGHGLPEGPLPPEVTSAPVFQDAPRGPQAVTNPFAAAEPETTPPAFQSTPAEPAGGVEFTVTDGSAPPMVRLRPSMVVSPIAKDEPESPAPAPPVAASPATPPFAEPASPPIEAEPGDDGGVQSAVAIDAWLERIRPVSHLEAEGGAASVQMRLPEESPAPSPPLVAAPETPKQEPLEPIPDPQSAGEVEIETASFNGVTPGVSTVAEVQKAWGAPKEVADRDSLKIHLYSVGPFERVEVSFFDDRVTSVVIRLGKAFPAGAVAKQLQLSAVRPVFVSNALGEILGQSFPERGVLFAFEPGEGPGKPSMKVTQIILEPITAEPFVLRAETNLDSQLEASARDLEVAVKLDPGNARAYWLQARVLFTLEQLQPALHSATQAVRLEPSNPQYRVTRAQVLGQLGQFALAVEEAQRAIETGDQRPHIKAHAVCLLGDLHGSGPQPDYKQAMTHHVEAMQIAEPLAQSPHPAIRLAAKEVLVNAHLGAAHDIAWGNWNQKEVAVPKWLERAAMLADDLVENEGASEEHRFRVAVRALAAYVGVQDELDPTPWAERALKSVEGLILASNAARKPRLQWDLGMALYDAVQIYQLRGEDDLALKYGQQAIDYLEKSIHEKQNQAADDYLLARLYFRMGAIHAVGKQDHAAAVAWFDKAMPVFRRVADQVGQAEFGRIGETYVSMGVSYWETDQRDLAVEITEEGIELIERLVKQGAMEPTALEVPYGNLATMHRFLGQNDKAEALLQKASQLKDTVLR